MSWTDTQANCFFEVCCGKDGKQLQATVEILMAEIKLSDLLAARVGEWLVVNRDYAPKGTLYGPKLPIHPAVLAHEANIGFQDATRVVNFVNLLADCAPKGSLYAFKEEIARLARGQAYE